MLSLQTSVACKDPLICLSTYPPRLIVIKLNLPDYTLALIVLCVLRLRIVVKGMHSSLPDTMLLQADSEQWQQQLPATALICMATSFGHMQQEDTTCILEVWTSLRPALTNSWCSSAFAAVRPPL